MSFQQGLSGLNAASKSLEVIGNNVSNANTVGFKQSQAIFADVFANSLTGSGASQIGIGTKIASVRQEFTEGNITNSNNPLDIAINGGGFFRLSDNGTVVYSRNGQFQLDKQGFIVNSQGQNLTGYTMVNGVLSTGSPNDLQINTADLPPSETTLVNGLFNLDSRKTELSSANFDQEDPTTYHHSTPVNVYDSLGNSHIMQNFFIKTDAGTWDVYTAVDGNTASKSATMTFDETGIKPTISPDPAEVSITVDNGAANMTVALDFSGSTQFGSNFSVNSQSQDGYTSGRLSSFTISNDGTIVGRYTNGQSATLGQVVLASFTNPNGLQSLGNNVWTETADSGPSLVGMPNSGNLGVMQSNAVEDSNVDLTAELVKMITAQRVYQANAQTIKTQDQVLQTLVNLR